MQSSRHFWLAEQYPAPHIIMARTFIDNRYVNNNKSTTTPWFWLENYGRRDDIPNSAALLIVKINLLSRARSDKCIAGMIVWWCNNEMSSERITTRKKNASAIMCACVIVMWITMVTLFYPIVSNLLTCEWQMYVRGRIDRHASESRFFKKLICNW